MSHDPTRDLVRHETRQILSETLGAELDLKWLAIERKLEQALAGLQARADSLQRTMDRTVADAKEVEERLAGRLAEVEAEASKRQRRQELKLAREERDRKIKRAERQIEDRGREAIDAIRREGSSVEEHARAEIEAAAERGALEVNERASRMLEAEGRLTALLDEITASAQRVHAADERTLVAMGNVFGRNGAGSNRQAPQAAD